MIEIRNLDYKFSVWHTMRAKRMPKNSGNNFSVFVSVLSTQVSITLIFLKSNCLPLPSLFFRDCSYLLYDINRQTAPVSILNQFVKTSQIHNYRTRSVSSDSFYVKFSRTDKMYAFFTRIGAQIWNSIPYSIKILKRSSFRKKIKELLLNFLRSEDDYVEVSRLIKLFNTLG